MVELQDTTESKSKALCNPCQRHHNMRVKTRDPFSEIMAVDTTTTIIIIIMVKTIIMIRAEEVSHQTVILVIGATKRDIISKIAPQTTTLNMSQREIRVYPKVCNLLSASSLRLIS